VNEELQHNGDDETPTVPAAGWRRGVGFVLRAGEYWCVFLLGLLCWTAERRNLALVVGALLAAIAFYITHRLIYQGRPRKRWGWLGHFLAILGILVFFATMLIPTIGPTRERARLAKIEADLRRIESLFGWYRQLNGEYPSRLEDLADMLQDEYRGFDDPWGNAYRYGKLDDGRLVLYSLGPDGDDDGAEKEFDRVSLWYHRSSFPFNLMPGFIYNLTYESKLADIDGDIRLFAPSDSQGP
jgi:hypothetical protein